MNHRLQWLTALIGVTLFMISTAGAQNITNYSFSTSRSSFTSLSSGTAITYSSSNYSPSIPIGFDFYYMGKRYNHVYSTWAGFLTFNDSALTHDPYIEKNNLDSSIIAFRPLLAPLWDDAINSSTGIYRTDGVSGNRVFTFEWQAVKWGSGSASIGFQVKLYEATGTIEFIYHPESGVLSSPSASIGITADVVGNGKFLSIDGTGSNPNASSIIETDSIRTKPDSGRVYAFTPINTLAPANLSFSDVGARGMVLHWTDSAADELSYVIYNSIDGVTYTYIDTASANAVQYTAKYLTPSTLYYWKIYAVREFLSPALGGSQSTGAPILSGVRTVGPTGNYSTLTAAIEAVANYGLAGNLTLELQSTYTSVSETFPITLPDVSAGADKKLTIQPAAGATGLSISGSSIYSTIMFNTGDYIVIDGRPGGVGSTIGLTIENTEPTGGSAISFYNDASNNAVKYCILKTIDTTANRGVIYFGTTSVPGAVGNNHNSIDHCTIDASMASSGIISLGTTTAPNTANTVSNNSIFDFAPHPTLSSIGVQIGSGSSGWTITGNSIYQTTAHSYQSAIMYGIVINIASAPANTFTITNNYIGGSAPTAGGAAWTVTGGSYRFMGIYFNGTQAGAEIQGNVFTNFNITSSANTSIFEAIYFNASTANIGTTAGNVIGSGTAVNTIQITASAATAAAPVVSGIRQTVMTRDVSIANNVIGGFTLASAQTNVGITFIGIQANGTISGNTIGSATVANSIVNTSGSASTSTLFYMYGIAPSGTGSRAADVLSNTIANIAINTTSTAFRFRGIFMSGGIANRHYTIAGNSIRDIRLAAANAYAVTGSCLFGGISVTTTNVSGYTYEITNTIVSNITSTDVSVAVLMYGIFSTGAIIKPGVIGENSIYSMTTSSPGSTIYGILLGSAQTAVRNNVIRLGIDASGNSITVPHTICGINHSKAGCSFTFNTVYIGGSGVLSGAAETYAFGRWYTGVDTIMNNIFVNARSSVDTAGRHLAFYLSGGVPLPGTSPLIDYNIYSAPGNGGIAAGNTATRYYTIQELRSFLLNQELHSCIDDPNFVNPDGSSTTFDLHVQSPSPAEGSGFLIPSVSKDRNGTLRNTLTPTDIGAYAGNNTIVDYFTPNFSNAILTPGRMTATRTISNIMITDVGTGIPTSGENVPQIWFRNQTKNSSWANAAGLLNSGNGNNGSWSFTITYALIGGTPAMGDTIQYYFVAQDQASPSHRWYSPYIGANHSDVSTQVTPPSAPGSFIIYAELSGTLNVPGNFPSLTGAGGLFANLKNAVLAGNLTVNITANLTEDGSTTFSNVFQETPGLYHITIQPDAAVERLISGNAATALLTLDGICDVVIDGRYNGAGQYLRFRNSANAPTIKFVNDACRDTIRNCTIEGASSIGTHGTVLFSSGILTGNDHNTIAECMIRGRSDSAAVPVNGIYSLGTSVSVRNSGNTITDCTIRNFSVNGIWIDAVPLANENWTITRNNIFTDPQTANLCGIQLGAAGSNNTISENRIQNLITSGSSAIGVQINAADGVSIAKNTLYLIESKSDYGYSNGIYLGITTPATVKVINNQLYFITPFTNRSYVVGVTDACSHANDTVFIDNNSIYIGGMGDTDLWSVAYYRQGYGISFLRNNILITERTYLGTPYENPIADDQSGGKLYSNYNFVSGYGPNGNDFLWAGSVGAGLDLEGWCAAAFGDSSSWALNARSFDRDSLFVNATNNDLMINSTMPYAWFVNGKGMPLAAVATDYHGTPRSVSVAGGATDIGAFEVTPTSIPPLATVNRSPALRDSSVFSFAGRTLGMVRWDSLGTVPDSVQLRYFSGTPLPGSLTQKHSDGYWGIQALGGSGYRYDLSLMYDEAMLGTIVSKDGMRMLKRESGSWQTLSGSTVNQANRAVTMKGLTSFTEFSLGDSTVTVPPPGAAIFSPTRTIVNFGPVRRGTVKVDSLYIRNTGTDTLRITAVVTSNPRFTFAPKDTFIRTSDSICYRITFHPDAVVSDTARILFTSGSPVKVDTIKAIGTSIWPIFTVVPDSIQFLSTAVSANRYDTLRVTNTGTADLVISSVTSSDTTQFKVASPIDTVKIGVTKNYAVKFIPAGLGYKRALITFVHTAPSTPSSIPVSGTGRSGSPAWTFQSNTGKNANIAIPSSINPRIGNQSLRSGDAIGVFFKRNDSLFCAGYTTWQEGQNAAITVWGDNDQTPEKDGLTESELMQYKIWSLDLDREYPATAQVQTGPGVNYQTNGIYVLSSLVGRITIVHGIVLGQGWNMISSFIAPKDSLVDTLFSGVKQRLVLLKNGGGQVYWPGLQINTLQMWQKIQGYQVYMTSRDTLRLSGEELNPQLTSIGLPAGWNLVPYLRNSEMRIDSALVSVQSALIIAKSGSGKVYWPYFTINTIGSMRPGQAYQLYNLSASTLTYPANLTTTPPSVLSKRIFAQEAEKTSEPAHFRPVGTETGSSAILLVRSRALKDGDEVAVRTSTGECIGSALVQDGKALLTIWGDNLMTHDVKEGAGEGELLRLLTWSGGERPLPITALTNALSGEVGGSALSYRKDAVSIADLTETAGAVPIAFSLDQNYPNPFNPSTTIRYDLPKDVRVTLDVYDLLGRKIASLVNTDQKAGYHSVQFQNGNFGSGVYFYTIVAGEYRATKKFVLLK